MRILFTLLICTLGISMNAQTNTQTNWKEVIQMDNIRNYVGHMGGESVNTCQTVGEVEYHTLSLAIKYESKTLINHILNQEDLDLSSVCDNKTILMYAIKYGDLNTVKRLIEKGADRKQVSKEGKDVLYYARKYEKREIYDYLK